ncbi:glutamine--fructose-6-phosphate transaminase (isomerizing) [Citromicrobium bathyomarinum]|uniref:glutamine--fructose-6-phosphate transaminase (isomerizing) n=1 Tax=Sphingomonadales TaxID=204457 RepID=UPI000C646179|nr:glutamine--fructose-6-phosphate transaminase (isomerizing) [Citromicrobium sp.]MBO82098.1 glutamine--fructose-6-phosphate transaminase (isomerizing) [Citromicrobium sp.]|tara:strand:+ start:6800 stop:8623 length:1824 start_codon:yes stop_codon:yes gene_type:complete
MCGIIGIISETPVADRLVDGLKRMEYRGYDSSGVCTIDDGQMIRRRAEGKLANLVEVLKDSPAPGTIGIAHTRWATHGAPTEANAHPHAGKAAALVHNGIIENFRTLRDELNADGYTAESETDSEVVALLVSREVERGASPEEAVRTVLPRLRGAFALAIVFPDQPDRIIGARLGSPLVIGHGEGEMFIGSDALALAPLTQRISYLEEGDWAVVTREGVQVHDAQGKEVEREIVASGASAAAVERGNYRHFMQKEIFEQPTVVAQTLSSYVRQADQTVALPQMDFDLSSIDRMTIVACGTSYYAGMVGRYWIEQFARVPVDIDVASEFRYREPPLPKGGLALFISQSGETADTLAALRYCKAQGQTIAAIVNVPTSTMAREADLLLPIHAGPEIGVASTKAFTCQLAVLAALAAKLAVVKGQMERAEEQEVVRHLLEAPACLNQALDHDDDIAAMAHTIAPARDVLYLGRGADFPMALEGALKLKEISYIHAEGYASGEMKHGPIALIDEDVPVVVIAPSGPLFEKTVSNMQEVRARGGQVVLISDADGLAEAGEGCLATIEMPKVHPLIAPLVYAVPVQLLAYHVALVKGTDVDQPRNLAKSVTVE